MSMTTYRDDPDWLAAHRDYISDDGAASAKHARRR
jgi:hypothetical protein